MNTNYIYMRYCDFYGYSRYYTTNEYDNYYYYYYGPWRHVIYVNMVAHWAIIIIIIIDTTCRSECLPAWRWPLWLKIVRMQANEREWEKKTTYLFVIVAAVHEVCYVLYPYYAIKYEQACIRFHWLWRIVQHIKQLLHSFETLQNILIHLSVGIALTRRN